MYANKLVTTRRAIENNNTCHSQVKEPDASNKPPDPRRDPSAHVVFSFFQKYKSANAVTVATVVSCLQKVWREADALSLQEVNRNTVTYRRWCGKPLKEKKNYVGRGNSPYIN
eukprot:770867-Pelagomonas_calceolata.AAC.1